MSANIIWGYKSTKKSTFYRDFFLELFFIFFYLEPIQYVMTFKVPYVSIP